MIFKKSALLSIILLPACYLGAQDKETPDIRVTMSDPIQNELVRTQIRNLFQDKDGYVYVVKSEQKVSAGEILFGPMAQADVTTRIEKYSPDLKKVYSEPMQAQNTGGKNLDYYGIYILDRVPWVFSSYFNKEQDKRYLFRHAIEDKGKLGPPVKIAEFDSKKGSGFFQMAYAPDSTRLAVVSRIPGKFKEPEQIHYTIYAGSGFEKVREASYSFPYNAEDIVVSDLELTQQGELCVMVSSEKKKPKKNESAYLQELFIFADGGEPVRKPIELKGNFLVGMRVISDAQGNLYALGLYNLLKHRTEFEASGYINVIGSAWMRIAREGWVASEPVLNPFRKSTYTFFDRSEGAFKLGYGIKMLGIFKAWANPDGSIFMDLQQGVSTTYQGRIISGTNYDGGMIMLVKIGPDGKVTDELMVPHNATGGGVIQGVGHILYAYKDAVFLLYNDNEANFRKPIKQSKDVKGVVMPGSSGIALTSSKPNAVLCRVGPDLKKEYYSIFDFRKMEVFLHTDDALVLKPGTLLVVGAHEKNFRLFKLELEE